MTAIVSILLNVFSIVAVCVAYWKDRIIEKNTAKVKCALRVNYVILSVIAILAVVNQYLAGLEAKALKKAEIKLSVARNLAQMNITILDNFFNIIKNETTIKNYVSYRKGVEKLPEQFRQRFSWDHVASDKLRGELQSVNQSLDELKRVAREILNISIQFPYDVPQPLVEWAALTLKLDNIEKLSSYLTAADNANDGVRYAELLGLGLGQNIRSIKIYQEELIK